MALIIRGSTRCAVCGEVLAEADQIVGLPHFATGQDDPHWHYSDARLAPALGQEGTTESSTA